MSDRPRDDRKRESAEDAQNKNQPGSNIPFGNIPSNDKNGGGNGSPAGGTTDNPAHSPVNTDGGTKFTGEAPGADIKKTVANVLGEIVWIMSQSDLHKTFFISDLEWLVMTPILLKQFRLFYSSDRPIGVALWARVDEEVEARLSAGNAKMKPQDWKSGDRLWVVEVMAPFGGHDEMLKDLKLKLFPNETFKYLGRKDGKPAVMEL